MKRRIVTYKLLTSPNIYTLLTFRYLRTSENRAFMITIISGSNRGGTSTRNMVYYYRDTLQGMGESPEILFLEGVDLNERTSFLEGIENKLLKPADKFIFILPEYNGSFPGAVKAFIDLCKIPECFYLKKALLTGIAYGRAGNLRGMEHFTGILNHMRVIVHPNKLPISVLGTLINDEKKLVDEITQQVIKEQLEEFLAF